MVIICCFMFVIIWICVGTVRRYTGVFPFLVALVVSLITLYGMTL